MKSDKLAIEGGNPAGQEPLPPRKILGKSELWKWIPKRVGDYKKTQNSINFRDRFFNILFHEQYGDNEINDIIASILKVEKFYIK